MSESDSVFIELEDEDDPRLLPTDSIFGIKSNLFLYYVQFICDPDTDTFSLLLKICNNDDDDDDDDDDDKELLTWTEFSLVFSPLVHTLVIAIASLPSKIATYYLAYLENEGNLVWIPEDVNCFLTILAEAREENYPFSFVTTIIQLNREYLNVLRLFDNLIVTRMDLSLFFQKIQIVYEACLIFLNFAHYELVSLQRERIFSSEFMYNFTLISTISDQAENNLNERFLSNI